MLMGSLVCACAANPHLRLPAAARRPDDPLILHLVNRTSFGPRPGDLARVQEMGVAAYLEQQLHPERIPDASADGPLTPLSGLRVTPTAFARDFYLPMIASRQNFTDTQKGSAKLAYLGWHLPPIAAVTLPDPARPSSILQQNTVTQPELLYQRQNQQVFDDLQSQKLLRAVNGQRQLEEVLTDFWFNHFNVDARKIEDKPVMVEYERDVIRPHVLGKFRDLLGAVAKSPAMLFYLDNWLSRANALNENYGREILELHTLGVDGGYTQKDVPEVARAFTGWTIENPRQGGGFVFNPRLHDVEQKIVLGHVIAAGGDQSDGEKVLDLLASHPSTARFIATKLVRRFVSDTPPPALVDRAAARFLATKGDLREVMHTILTSKEFRAPDAYAAKVKSPFEFVVSAVRALGAEVDDATPLVGRLRQLGMPLYQCQPPTGYKDTADAWINTGALVARMNFAVALTEGKVRGTAVASNEPTAMTLGGPDFQRR